MEREAGFQRLVARGGEEEEVGGGGPAEIDRVQGVSGIELYAKDRFEDLDPVLQVAAGTAVRRPANGAELADVDVDLVLPLELDHRLQRRFELGLVPSLAVDLARIPGRCPFDCHLNHCG